MRKLLVRLDNGLENEVAANHYDIYRDGSLIFAVIVDGAERVVVCFAAGVWRDFREAKQ